AGGGAVHAVARSTQVGLGQGIANEALLAEIPPRPDGLARRPRLRLGHGVGIGHPHAVAVHHRALATEEVAFGVAVVAALRAVIALLRLLVDLSVAAEG